MLEYVIQLEMEGFLSTPESNELVGRFHLFLKQKHTVLVYQNYHDQR
jgi:hypothetical protein